MKGSIIRGISLSDLNGRTIDEVLAGPKRVARMAFCERCGCKLSSYRATDETLCCSCSRAENPLFRRVA